eukprot:1847864-Rhodomonas_salina.1
MSLCGYFVEREGVRRRVLPPDSRLWKLALEGRKMRREGMNEGVGTWSGRERRSGRAARKENQIHTFTNATGIWDAVVAYI